MKNYQTIIIIALLLGNLIGAFFIYKAFKLRDEVQTWKQYHDGAVAKLNQLSDDYPGNSVYKLENSEILNSTTKEERKQMTVLFGASITKNWDINSFFPNKKLINRGVGSQSDTQLLTRFSSDVLQLEPGYVVLKF